MLLNRDKLSKIVEGFPKHLGKEMFFLIRVHQYTDQYICYRSMNNPPPHPFQFFTVLMLTQSTFVFHLNYFTVHSSFLFVDFQTRRGSEFRKTQLECCNLIFFRTELLVFLYDDSYDSSLMPSVFHAINILPSKVIIFHPSEFLELRQVSRNSSPPNMLYAIGSKSFFLGPNQVTSACSRMLRVLAVDEIIAVLNIFIL